MMPLESSPARGSRVVIGARVLVLGFAGLLMLVAAWTNSVTLVETGELPAGLAAWQRHALGLYRVCGPLSKFLYALPPYLAGVRVEYPADYDQDLHGRLEWAVGGLFEESTKTRYVNLYRWTRLLPILVTLLGGVLVCEWSTRLFGAWPGVGALCAWCFMPLVLGHGSLVTSDVISAVTLLLAARTFWSFLVRPSLAAAGVAGLALGLAQATKFTLLVLYPCWGFLVVLRVVLEPARSGDQPRGRRLKTLGLALASVALSVVVLDALYLFQEIGIRPAEWRLDSSSAFALIADARERPELAWLLRIPAPIPMEYLRGLDVQIADTERSQTAYLLGTSRLGGWWYWYPVAALFKVPLPLLLLAGIGLARLPKEIKGESDRFWAAWCILLPAAETAIAIMGSTGTGTNAAFRYMIPTIGLVCVWVGRVWESRSRLVRSLATGLVVWAGLDALGGMPDQLAWQNELGWAWEQATGKPALIGDSLDWGQNVLRLSDWVKRHAHEGSTLVEVDSLNRGATYGLEPPAAKATSEPWKESAYLAISKNVLYGYQGGARLSMSEGHQSVNPEQATELARHRPFDRVGRSIVIYRIGDLEREGFDVTRGTRLSGSYSGGGDDETAAVRSRDWRRLAQGVSSTIDSATDSILARE